MALPLAPTPPARRRLPPAVVALGLTSFFTDVGSEMVFPLLPVLLASVGAAPALLGLIEGLAEATASLLKLGSGALSDRLPAKKPLVVLGYGIAALARPLFALATAPWHVLAIRLTDRVGKGIRTAPRDALIASAVDAHEAGRAFGFHRAMDHAGAVVGPLIAATLLALGWELRSVLWFALLPGLLALVAVLTVREGRPSATVSPPEPSSAPGTPPGAARPALPPALRGYLGVLALFSLGNSSDAFLLLRAGELGVPVAALPVLWGAFHVVKLISAYVGGGWADRVPRVWLIASGWAVYAAAYLAFGVASRPWHAWAIFGVYGAYYGLTEPAEKALVRDLAPAALRGRAYGAYHFVIGITAVPAGVLTGWLWQAWSPRGALGVGAALAAVAAAALMLWARSARGDQPRRHPRGPPG